MNPNIKLIRKLEWEEVFLFWYENEGKDPNWQDEAKKRGFNSWADWRLRDQCGRFECTQAEWGLYEIENPSEVISDWFGGPFRTWIELYYGDQKTKSFSELADHPVIKEHSGVKSMVDNYPKDSIITALQLSDDRIFVIEGSHRSCALALMKKLGKPFPEKLIFAIGKSKLSELPVVGKNTTKI